MLEQELCFLLLFSLMRKFWIIYAAVAVAGSVGIYWTAPLARPLMARFVKQEEKPAAVEKSSFMKDTFVTRAEDPVTDAPLKPELRPAAVPEVEAMDDPPALIGIFRVSGREKPSWGVIQIKTNLYAEDGKRLGEVPAGVVVNYQETRVSSKGSMVVCILRYKGKEAGPYLIKRSDLILFTGDYEKLSANQRASLEAYYKTKGTEDERKKELMQQLAVRNPHYTQYKAAYDTYMAHIDESKELSVKRDKAEGLTRSSLDDQLRRLKNEEAGLQKRYNEIHLKYKEWKQANAASLPDPEKDEQVREYRREMQRLSKLIPGLAY